MWPGVQLVLVSNFTNNAFFLFGRSTIKLKYEDLEVVKADRVNTVVFNLHLIKQRNLSLGHR